MAFSLPANGRFYNKISIPLCKELEDFFLQHFYKMGVYISGAAFSARKLLNLRVLRILLKPVV